MGDFLFRSLVIGIGATALLDLWTLLLNRVFGWPLPNWGFVGRWFGHIPQGRFAHQNIATSSPVRNELAVGWIGHYLVGILFAAALLAIWGLDWARNPTLLPALIVGLVTVGCGWFILQPGLGLGVAASKRPDANRIRALNIANHIVFGIGLFLSALIIR